MDLDVHLPSIAAGDASAFAAWLAGAEPAVRGALRSFAAVVDVEAVVQEALLRAWQVAARVEPDGRPNALLRLTVRIAKNHAIDQARRARLDYTEPAEMERVEVEPALPDPLLRAQVERCREQLPAAPARALTARLTGRGGASDRDLAASVQMELNTFLKNVGRARAWLIECLARAGVEVA